METGTKPNHPPDPHITVGRDEYLAAIDVNKRMVDHFPDTWQTPRPIVFLMACESAVTTVATLNDFVTAWNGAGAAAIVGTEAVVDSELAAACAAEIVQTLWNGATLGEAFSGFRKKLLEGGNPLGFLFQAIGDVDLVLH
jgi:hypothetical protein